VSIAAVLSAIEFWLDANVFITSKNAYYPFDLFPAFWSFLDKMIAAGRIASPRLVYQELEAAGDELSQWVKARANSGLFADPDADVQASLAKVANYVVASYSKPEAELFLKGADPWLVAHAMTQGGTVVTLERYDPQAKKAKIPNVCAHFGVKYVNTFDMLRALGASFS
jgi:hypothetical protein